jgi:hypothetical protein
MIIIAVAAKRRRPGNDGSHFAREDLHLPLVSIDDSIAETCLKMLRAIFDRSGYLARYKMMTGDG